MANVPEPVPAESFVNLSLSLEAKIPSANGDGKYYLNKPLEFYRHDGLTTLVLLMSSTNFLNCLSVATKLSVLQACNTVA
jgi:hypothetical protein